MSKGNKKAFSGVSAPLSKANIKETVLTALGEPSGVFGRPIIQAMVVFLLAFGIYANTIPNYYVQDDSAAILENRLVQEGVHGIPTLLKTGFIYGLTGSNEGTYRPVSLISYAVEISLWGQNPHMSHLINILLYAITVVLLLYVLRLMFGKKYGLLCFVAVLLYTAHPIHTEAVASIKSRDEIFSFLFALLSMFSFLKLSDSMDEKAGSKIGLWLFAGILSFFLSMVSKEGSIPFVALIPLAIYYFRNKQIKPSLIIAGCSAVAVGAYLFLRHALFGSISNVHVAIQKADNILANTDGGRQPLATAFVILIKYIKLLILPHPLSYDYSFHQLELYTWSDWQALVSLVIVAGLIIYALVRLPKKEITGFSILFFFGTIAVVANIFMIIGSAMGERFLYMPSLGYCIIIAFLLIKYVFRPSNGNISNVGWALTLIIVGLYSFKTITRNTNWKDNITLYAIDVKSAPNSCRTHYSLGTQLNTNARTEKDSVKRMAMLQEAESELQKALEINPEYPDAMINLGNVYHELGQFDKELEMLNHVSSNAEGTAKVLFNSGNTYLSKNDFKGAILKYRAAVALKPEITLPYVNMGIAYSSLGMVDSAIFFLEKALVMDPKMIQIYINLGSAYSAKGNQYLQKAINLYNKGLEIDPKSGEIYINLGSAEINAKRYDQAIIHLNKGIQYKPEAPEAYYNLGYAYQLKNNYGQALDLYAQALKRKDLYPEALINTGFCYEQSGQYQKAISYFEKILSMNPNQLQAIMNLGYCYTKLNDKNKAIEYYNRAVQISPNEYNAYASLKGIYKALKDKEKEKYYYQKYLEAKKNAGVK